MSAFTLPKVVYGFVFNSIKEGLNDLFFKARRTRKGCGYRISNRIGKLVVSEPQHIHLDTSRNKGHDGMHMLGDAWRGVKCNRGPNKVDIRRRNPASGQELSRSSRSIDLKAFRLAAVFRHQADVMKHRARIEQLSIEIETATPP